MHIGIDAASWSNSRGYGRHVRELTRALVSLEQVHRYRIVTTADATCDLAEHRHVEVVRVPEGHARRGMRSAGMLWRMSSDLSDPALDVVFFPSPLTFVPSWRPRPSVVALHDSIAHRFPGLVFDTWRSSVLWNAKVRMAVRQASRIVTVSEHARVSLVRDLGLGGRDIHIVGEAPAPVFFARADPAAGRAARLALGVSVDAPVVVAHGALAPHKNLHRLIRAFHQVATRPRLSSAVLLLIGEAGSQRERAHLVRLGAAGPGRVLLPGRLDDATLVAVLHEATVAVLPALDEGLGLPGLEAAACGVPLAATRSSAMPELLGDAAVYFDPEDEQDMADAIGRLLDDSGARQRLGAEARARVGALSWTQAARDLLVVLEEVASGG
jgi:glycosyltransferase involved in cell wall biosynthesis